MIQRSEKEKAEVATLLLDTLQTSPALRLPAKAGVKAGLQQAWRSVCASHTNYDEINKNLPPDKYPVQSRAIAVIAVDWLQGEDIDWERFIETLLKQPAK